MNNSLEYEGKSVEDALEKASRALKVPKEKIQYTVISYGSTGIFGLVGVKKAKIRVKSSQDKKDTQKSSVLSLVDEAFGVTEKKRGSSPKPKNEKKKSAPEPERKAQSEVQEKKDLPERNEEEKTSKPSSRRKPSRKPRGNRAEHSGKGKKPAQGREAEVEDLSETPLPVSEESFPQDTAEEFLEVLEPEDSAQEDLLPLDPGDEDGDRPLVEASPEMVERGREALEKILSYIGDDVRIESESSGGRILYNLNSANAAIIIGKRGQTLEAIQYIVDKVVNRDKEGRVRIQLDVEGYIETRKAQLRQLALKQAEKAKKTGKPATIGQMSAHDRRIIHLALKDDRNVRTQSVGEGFYRRLVIFPKKNGRKPGPQKGEN